MRVRQVPSSSHHFFLVYFVNRPARRRGERGVGVADEVALGAVRVQLVPVAGRREEAHRLARLRHDGVGQQVVRGVGDLSVVVDLQNGKKRVAIKDASVPHSDSSSERRPFNTPFGASFTAPRRF